MHTKNIGTDSSKLPDALPVQPADAPPSACTDASSSPPADAATTSDKQQT